ncbi:serine protease [Streptomyces rhizosphaerihabitans]|uniref:serine protease n=1 Tax=Streptomyces rhizosphaerihabitans TaxID=1266770 RepID=UPI0021BE18CD|nr:serine protease [Streptomyces rhizosphaerihabitans]MCT9004119.1 serine protease [Streptomyces rhizosphaerihabitans]
MNSASWQARITCGRETGAGFLVTERHVLTCAHVVARSGTAQVGVSFAREEAALPAKVVAHGGWDGHDTDPGDVAVLELDRSVPLEPAEFAAPSDAYGDPPRRLVAYGFPKRYEEGTLAEYRATADQLIADEWVQLEAWAAHGQPLAPGFSGAAVTLADTGRVVGMVSAAARDAGIRNGRMLPAHVMARYWPRLGELIPTPEYGRVDKERLRELVLARGPEFGGRPECSPERLYSDAVGPFGPPLPGRRFRSLWDAAWYLLSEVPDTGAVARFAARLADFTEDAPTRGALRAWPSRAYDRRPRPSVNPPDRAAGTQPWSPILVEIAPSGSGEHQFLVEVSAYNGRHRRVVGSRALPADRVRGYALERIDEAYHELEPGARELIAFVLPRRWLNTDVAHWQRSADDDSPLGSFAPLVVMDLERRRSGGLQHKLLQKWQRLDGQSAPRLHRIDCGALGQDPVRLTIGLRRGADMVGFASPPRAEGTRRLFRASLNAAVPVMLWPRSGCRGETRGGAHEDCTGAEFLDRLAAHLADLSPSELPSHIHELRETAYADDGPEPHWANDLALLWEDPRCLPDPVGYLHSPVG